MGAFSSIRTTSRVHVFEPRRLIRQLLCANLTLNDLAVPREQPWQVTGSIDAREKIDWGHLPLSPDNFRTGFSIQHRAQSSGLIPPQCLPLPAHAQHKLAQPAVNRVGLEPWVPHLRNGDLSGLDRKLECVDGVGRLRFTLR